MGRKKKEENFSETIKKPFSSLKEETLQGVLAVVFFVLGVFLLLAAFGKAGRVGDIVFSLFSSLFGYGYYVLSLFFFMLCISFFQTLERRFALTQTIGSLVFFFSTLGIIEILLPSGGGMVGRLISHPLTSLFEVYAAGIILVALLVISFLIVFDTALKLDFLSGWRTLFSKKQKNTLSAKEEQGLSSTPEQTNPTTISDEKSSVLGKIFDQKRETLAEDPPFALPTKRRVISLTPFSPPPLSLLERDKGKPGVGDVKANANIIKRTLQNFGIAVEMDEVSIGPSITRYALKPAEGVKLSKILGLQNNLELALAAHPVRIEAPIPGKSLVGIEMPNTTKTTVGLGSLLSEPEFQDSDKPLLVSLGKGISGKSHFANIAKMPHLLIAGATGSGKSVTIHAIIASLLFRSSPETLKLIMIDPKRVELTLYNKIPHLLTPVITEAKKAILALKWAAKEMDRRYDVLEECSVRDIESYHKNILEPELDKLKAKGKTEGEDLPETMPYIVVVIDELADIMQAYPRELESAIVRLAQMSRAVGIHLILSTQRPSVNVITGLIKANIPSRVALQVASQIDSRTILDMAGAEKLLGAGDMLFMSGEMSKPQRIQSAYITEVEVKKLAKYLTDSYANEIPSEIIFGEEGSKNSLFEATLGATDEDGDDLYEEARQVVVASAKASTSYLQRKLGVGYARAARLMDMLEERGVVGPGSGSKPRDVLMKNETMRAEMLPDEHEV